MSEPFPRKRAPVPRPNPAFTRLLGDLRRQARSLARSAEDADDLVQDTLLRVWARLEMDRQGASDAAPLEDLGAYAVATLRARARARRGQGLRPLPHGSVVTAGDSAEAGAAVRPGAPARIAVAETLAALDRLPTDQAQVLRLRGLRGLSYAEIAAETGLPLGTVTSRLARGRAALRDALGLDETTPIRALFDKI
jgi:RNA polymerase sigma-70 factor (ECF subfamily)